MYPIKTNGIKVTSKFGKRTYMLNGKKISDFHKGIDLIAQPNNKNEFILAMYDGVVSKITPTGKNGGTSANVRIKHNNGWYTYYTHLKSNSIVVKVGQKVNSGQHIATIGDTGKVTGLHLHFQIDKGSSDTAIDPYDYLFKGKKLDEDKPKQEIKYIVKKGDNLSKIAKMYKTTWQTIYKNNKSKIDIMAKKHGVKENYQNYLYVGTELVIK